MSDFLEDEEFACSKPVRHYAKDGSPSILKWGTEEVKDTDSFTTAWLVKTLSQAVGAHLNPRTAVDNNTSVKTLLKDLFPPDGCFPDMKRVVNGITQYGITAKPERAANPNLLVQWAVAAAITDFAKNKVLHPVHLGLLDGFLGNFGFKSLANIGWCAYSFGCEHTWFLVCVVSLLFVCLAIAHACNNMYNAYTYTSVCKKMCYS